MRSKLLIHRNEYGTFKMLRKNLLLTTVAATLCLQAPASFAQQAGGAHGGAASQGSEMGAGGKSGGGKEPGVSPGGQTAPSQAGTMAQPGRSDSNQSSDDQPTEPRAAPGSRSPDANTNKPGKPDANTGKAGQGEPNENKEGGAAPQKKSDQTGGGEPQNGSRNSGSAQTGQQREHPARIDHEHQGRVRDAIRGLGVHELAHVAFALDVGTHVPHDVDLRPLPPAVISIYPDYRGYDFILVHGDIIVIDPETYEIVDVFPA